MLADGWDEEILDDVAFEKFLSFRIHFCTLRIAANGSDVWSVGKSTQCVVNGEVGLTCQQHTLAAFCGLVDDLRNDGGLSGSRWPLNQEHILSRQCTTNCSFLFFIHWTQRFVFQRRKITRIFSGFVDVEEPFVNVVARFQFLKSFDSLSLSFDLNQIT